MTTHKEALTLALEALESERMYFWNSPEKIDKAITAIKEALAQPEQEPITKLFGTLPIYDEHEFRKGFIAGQRDAFNRLEEQPEQEPVAMVEIHEFYENCAKLSLLQKLPKGTHNLYTTPPQRKPLTDEQIDEVYYKSDLEIERQYNQLYAFVRAIEAAHGIKGDA